MRAKTQDIRANSQTSKQTPKITAESPVPQVQMRPVEFRLAHGHPASPIPFIDREAVARRPQKGSVQRERSKAFSSPPRRHRPSPSSAGRVAVQGDCHIAADYHGTLASRECDGSGSPGDGGPKVGGGGVEEGDAHAPHLSAACAPALTHMLVFRLHACVHAELFTTRGSGLKE